MVYFLSWLWKDFRKDVLLSLTAPVLKYVLRTVKIGIMSSQEVPAPFDVIADDALQSSKIVTR